MGQNGGPRDSSLTIAELSERWLVCFGSGRSRSLSGPLRVQWRLFVLQKRPGPRLRNADPRLRSQINRWFGDASLLFVKPRRMSSCHRLVCLSVVAVAWAREAAIVTRFISDLGLEVDCTIKRGSKPARSGLSREQTRSIAS